MTSARPTSIRCGFCGVDVPVQPIGVMPKTCGTACRSALWRWENPRTNRRYRTKGYAAPYWMREEPASQPA